MGGVISTPKKSNSNLREEMDKKENKNSLSEYLVGRKDTIDYTITEIYAREKEFIIFGSKGDSGFHHFKITFDTINEYDEVLTKNFQCVEDKFRELILYLDKVNADASYKVRASNAILIAIRGNITEAKTLLKKQNLMHRKNIEDLEDYIICLAHSFRLLLYLS